MMNCLVWLGHNRSLQSRYRGATLTDGRNTEYDRIELEEQFSHESVGCIATLRVIFRFDIISAIEEGYCYQCCLKHDHSYYQFQFH